MEKKLTVKEDMICPISNHHCDDECCTVGAECNLSGRQSITSCNKKTAVQWLDNELWSLRLKLRGGEITIGQYNEHQIILIKQALQMEREQIEEAVNNGVIFGHNHGVSWISNYSEIYYTSTFNH